MKILIMIFFFLYIADKPSKFGQQRLWGAVGWGTFSALTGYLVDQFSKGKTEKNYTIIFYLMLVIITLNIVSGRFLKVIFFFFFFLFSY